jgi:hypothetical protein
MNEQSYIESQSKHIDAMLNIAQRLKGLEQDNERLQAEVEKQAVFIAEFEVWLKCEIATFNKRYHEHNWDKGYESALDDTDEHWRKLKTQHGLNQKDSE